MFARELIETMTPHKTRLKIGQAISQGYTTASLIYKTHEVLQNEFGRQIMGHMQYVSIQCALKTMADSKLLPGLVSIVSKNDRDYKFLELVNDRGQSIAIARSSSPDIPGRYAVCREKRILTNYYPLFPECESNYNKDNGFLLLCFGGGGFEPEFGKVGVPELGGRTWHDSEPVLTKKHSSVQKDVSDIIDPRKLAEEVLEVIKHGIKKSVGSDNPGKNS